MEKDSQKRPYPLDLDIDQWRSDIQTFVNATDQALEAIVNELSASCTEQGSSFSNSSMPINASVDLKGDDRLAKLKSQIADRLAKSN